MNSLLYLMWLHLMPALPPQKCISLIEYFGSLEKLYDADYAAYKESGILTKTMIDALMQKSTKKAMQEIEKAAALQVHLIHFFDASYPESLKELNDPPLILYVKGNPSILRKRAVFCIVGSRHCTAYGMSAALGISEHLARCGMVIVSGFAVGIDTAAHRGALRAKGETIAVLGCGIDVDYPYENTKLKEEIVKNGAIISEFPFGTPPYGTNFPFRNRVLSGLSLGVAVMEAGERSGSLITTRYAAEQGKDVYALPGNVSNPFSAGTNKLIQDGASLLLGAEEILTEYIVRYPEYFEIGEIVKEKCVEEESESFNKKDMDKAFQYLQEPSLVDNEKVLYRALDKNPKTIDELCSITSISIKEVNSLITTLQIKGKIKEHPGARYSL